ncbi:hypothetical protein SGPA1_20294 [Streptomyces misionensis JCM 4497]
MVLRRDGGRRAVAFRLPDLDGLPTGAAGLLVVRGGRAGVRVHHVHARARRGGRPAGGAGVLRRGTGGRAAGGHVDRGGRLGVPRRHGLVRLRDGVRLHSRAASAVRAVLAAQGAARGYRLSRAGARLRSAHAVVA